MTEFSFGTAISHWSKTEGPSGFIWKYLAFYGGIVIAMALIVGLLLGPIYVALLQSIGDLTTDPEAANNAMEAAMAQNVIQIVLGYLVALLLGWVLWAVFECAAQRRYIRGDRFSLRFGADERRMMVVGLIWIIMIILLYFGIAIVTGILMMPLVMMAGDNSGLIIFVPMLVILVVFGVMSLFIVRWSAAAALTIRDEKIHFFHSWSVTKGKFWPMFGAFLVLSLILGVGWFLIYGAFLASVMGPAIAAGNSAGSMSLGPVMIVIMVVLYLALLIFQAFAGFVMAGVAALAAKSDPEYSGLQAANVFD